LQNFTAFVGFLKPIYPDEKTLFPVNLSFFDDVGLFENYDNIYLILTMAIDPKEFTRRKKIIIFKFFFRLNRKIFFNFGFASKN